METRCWLNCDDWKMESAKNVNFYSIMPLTTEDLFSIILLINSIDAVTASRPAELHKNRKSFHNESKSLNSKISVILPKPYFRW